MIGLLTLWLLGAVVCGFVGQAVGVLKGMSTFGAVLGVVLGPVGVVVVALLPRTAEAEAEYRLAVDAAMETLRHRR